MGAVPWAVGLLLACGVAPSASAQMLQQPVSVATQPMQACQPLPPVPDVPDATRGLVNRYRAGSPVPAGPNVVAPAAPGGAGPAVQRAMFQLDPADTGTPAADADQQRMQANPFELPVHDGSTATAPGFTLPQAVGIAMQFNPILQRSIARIESAEGDALQSGLYPNPRFDTNNPQVFAGKSTSLNYGFIQEIPVKGKLRLDKAAASQVVRQREHGLVQDRHSLLMTIRQQFYVVLAAQRRVEVLIGVQEIAAAAVRAAEGRVKATEGTLPEVLLLQTELQRAQISLRNAQTNLEAGRRQLSSIIGRPDLNIDRLSGELGSGFPEFDPEYLRHYVVSENVQVQIARREIERNQILLRRARVEPYPNPTLGPASVYTLPQSQNGQQFWFNVYFDIPTWNRNQGGIQAAEANIADATASLGVLQNDLLRQAEDALGRYRQARQTEERYRTQILPTATKAAQLVKDGYQKGVLDISTYLQAQRALSDASSSYIDALQDVWATGAELANLLQLERFP